MSADPAMGFAGCESGGTTAVAPGILAHIVGFGRGASQSMAMVMQWIDGASVFHQFGFKGLGVNGTLSYERLDASSQVAASAPTPYDSISMQWWRLRPIDRGVVAETSPDAYTWTTLYEDDFVVPDQASLEISTNSYGAAAGNDFAIDSFGACP